jgi:hypothetical protein
MLKMDWQPCTNCCLEITRQVDRGKLIGTPTILPLHARAGRGRAEAGHTSRSTARFFSDFRDSSFRLAVLFSAVKKFLQVIAALRAWPHRAGGGD